ncbi:MAG: preprotein translocase subunit SecA, partial [Spirochaetes bacterium]|nr:preprotein translocase subunit SecA [Spirochaetota bacterium]
EAKEGLKIQQESITLATVTFQNYFRIYNKLSGMTGTAITEAEEFSKIYKLDVTVIPTNKQMIRKDMPDRIYKNESGKFKAIAEEIKERNSKGHPILVGTISIEKNELLGRMLDREGVKYELLNAKNHEREAKIVANAGKVGAVTVATNMAGRGVDIVLGGAKENFNSDEEWRKEYDKVISAGGLYILGTERHESRRIDNQLRGRSGRQGDAGESRFFVSMEDDLMRIFGGERMKGIMERFNFPEDMPIENALISRSIEQAQKKVEGNNFDIRKHLVEYDDVINKHRETIYKRRKEILEIAELNDNSKSLDIKSKISNQFLMSNDKISKNKQISNQTPNENSLSDVILEMVGNEIEQVAMFHTAGDDFKKWDLKEIYETVNTIFPLPQDKRLKAEDIPVYKNSSNQKVELRSKIIDYLIKLAKNEYSQLQQKISSAGIDFIQVEKEVILRSIDNLWIEHLGAMDHLRTGIGLRGYGQQDPLVEYKKEAYRLFTELMNLIQKQVVYTIYKIGLTQNFAPAIMEAENTQISNVSSTGIIASEAQKRESQNSVSDKTANQDGKKVGRNDPCPCGAKKADGSPKKYKHCCGK